MTNRQGAGLRISRHLAESHLNEILGVIDETIVVAISPIADRIVAREMIQVHVRNQGLAPIRGHVPIPALADRESRTTREQLRRKFHRRRPLNLPFRNRRAAQTVNRSARTAPMAIDRNVPIEDVETDAVEAGIKTAPLAK